MMFNDFLDELNLKSIKISFSEGKLKYEGPENNLTHELIENLHKYKESLIRHYWPVESPNFMPINPVGSKIPFVMVYFEVMNYPLSNFLGKDQPFYGFLHYGCEGGKIRHKSVESFATDYIIQMQKVIPKGPYLLGGFSFGGVIAFEMAIQLQKAGYEVPFLTLLDSMTNKPFIWHSNIFNIVKSNILGPVRRKIEQLIKVPVCNVFLLLKKPVPVSLRNYYIVNKYKALGSKYKKGKFKGELLLFKSDLNGNDFKYNGWDSFVEKVNVVTYKGEHLAIAREDKYAGMIGKEFMNHLAKVYQPSR